LVVGADLHLKRVHLPLLLSLLLSCNDSYKRIKGLVTVLALYRSTVTYLFTYIFFIFILFYCSTEL